MAFFGLLDFRRLVLGDRHGGHPSRFFVNEKRFHHAARCEQMRVDRNGSVLSILLLTPSSRCSPTRSEDQLEPYLRQRLRITDTAGRFSDGRIGILLPDTPEAGAWKVASEVCEFHGAGQDPPSCEVVVYSGSGGGVEDSEQGIRGGPVRVPIDAVPVASMAHSRLFFSQPLPRWKRSLDILGGTMGLLLFGPLVAISAAAIRMSSPGPAFFVQERAGLGGRAFRILKLRTMRVGADAMKHQLRAQSDQDGPAFKMTHDPRVTAVGRWLRKLSIDELPQFWNVVCGQMSLVGPRPLPVDESQACEVWQRRRLDVTPGMTCIWQVTARNSVSFEEWIRMDIQYIESRSLRQDLWLILKTLPVFAGAKGAR